MKLVLQCAMCGTHHPVGTTVCSTCRASGVTQLRLMFECPKCARLGISPTCDQCPHVVPLELDGDLIVAEEVADESVAVDDLKFDFELDLDESDGGDEFDVIDEVEGFDPGAGEAIVLDLTEEGTKEALELDEEPKELDEDE